MKVLCVRDILLAKKPVTGLLFPKAGVVFTQLKQNLKTLRHVSTRSNVVVYSITITPNTTENAGRVRQTSDGCGISLRSIFQRLTVTRWPGSKGTAPPWYETATLCSEWREILNTGSNCTQRL